MSSKEIQIKNKTNKSQTDFITYNDDESDSSDNINMIDNPEKQTTKSITRVKFLPSEDKTIIDLVSNYGTDWKVISQLFGPSRTKRQIRERWQNYLNPDCNPLYTDEEDQMLMDLVNEMGTKWSKIAEIIGKKSAISCRNRHRILVKEMNRKSSNKSAKLNKAQKKNDDKVNLTNAVDKTDANIINLNNNNDNNKEDLKAAFDDIKFDDDDYNDDSVEDINSFFLVQHWIMIKKYALIQLIIYLNTICMIVFRMKIIVV